MPDIRDILDALDIDDKKLYAQTRTRMRTAYLKALSEIVGISNHDESDDQILDWIDIKIGSLFDRCGRFDNSTGKLKDVTEIENKIEKDGQEVLNKIANAKLPINQWPSND